MVRAYVAGGILAAASIVALALAPGIYKSEKIGPLKSEPDQQILEPMPARIFSAVASDKPAALGSKADAIIWPQVKLPTKKIKADSGMKPNPAKPKQPKRNSPKAKGTLAAR